MTAAVVTRPNINNEYTENINKEYTENTLKCDCNINLISTYYIILLDTSINLDHFKKAQSYVFEIINQQFTLNSFNFNMLLNIEILTGSFVINLFLHYMMNSLIACKKPNTKNTNPDNLDSNRNQQQDPNDSKNMISCNGSFNEGKLILIQDIYQNYLKFNRGFNTYLHIIIQKTKIYSDEKSFYRDFEQYLTLFYKYEKQRRSDGYHFTNVEKLSLEQAENNREIKLSEIYNSEPFEKTFDQEKQFECYRHAVMRLFNCSCSKNSLQKMGQKLITFWIMIVFIDHYTDFTEAIENAESKAENFYKLYEKFLEIFLKTLLKMQDSLKFYDNDKFFFEQKFQEELFKKHFFGKNHEYFYIDKNQKSKYHGN